MSRKKKLRKALLAGAALYGASKLAGMNASKAISGKTTVSDAQKMTQIPAKKVDYITKKKTVKTVTDKKIPGQTVNYKGEVIKKGTNTGVGNKKTKFVNLSPDKGEVGIYQGGKKVSELNQKAINVLSDGKIQTQNKTFADKKEYRKFMDEKRAKKRNSSGGGGFKNFMNKYVLGEKTQMRTGKMVKARGGGMARTKPTKMY